VENKANPGIFFIVGLIILIIGVLVLSGSIKEFNYSREFEKDGKLTNSQVVGVDYNYSSSPPDRIYIFKVDVNGTERKIRYSDYTTNIDRFTIGQTVPVFFIERSNKIRLQQDLKIIPIRSLLFSIFLILLGVALILFRNNISNAYKKGIIKHGDL
jgi:hypothetical protein